MIERAEVFRSLDEWAAQSVLPLLKPVKESWQPHDLLPDPASEGFEDEIREIRKRAAAIPDDYFVVLVGDMVTEEALPTYQTRLNATEGYKDESGVDSSAWAVWTRGWSAEEKRHGDLLSKYLYLCGRVDMRRVEATVHHLIASGMDIGTGSDPYLLTIYTSFQERATAISHGNTAKLAATHGDAKLAQICGTIAADEKRHEAAYTRIAAKLFEVDPEGMVEAMAHMMRRKVGMPAQLMYDGRDRSLFKHFSEVAARLGVYTAAHYRLITEHLIHAWNVESLRGLSPRGRLAQDYVCGLPLRFRRLEDRPRQPPPPPIPFSWIFDRLA